MAFCNNFTDISATCGANPAGGLTRFYIAPWDAVAFTANTQGIITGLTLSPASAITAFSEFEFLRGNASYTENSTGDVTKGGMAYSYEISLTLTKREASKRAALLLIAQGLPKLAIIVKHSDGEIVAFFGTDDASYFTAEGGGVEAAKDGNNNYVLTFSYQSNLPAYHVSSTLLPTII